jgi:hypothetical protein
MILIGPNYGKDKNASVPSVQAPVSEDPSQASPAGRVSLDQCVRPVSLVGRPVRGDAYIYLIEKIGSPFYWEAKQGLSP